MSTLVRIEGTKYRHKDSLEKAVTKIGGQMYTQRQIDDKVKKNELVISEYVGVPREKVLAAFSLPGLRNMFVVDKEGDLITESDNTYAHDVYERSLADLSHNYVFDMMQKYAEVHGMFCEEVEEEGRRLITLTA